VQTDLHQAIGLARRSGDEQIPLADAREKLGVDGMMISPGYNYAKAPDQEHFLRRARTQQLFREILARPKRRWRFNQSSLYLSFLAGNETYECTPWGAVTRNVFGWQKPCYLLVGEGYARSYRELIEETDWERYGTGRNPKCANCMAHCGYEMTAVDDTFRNPLKALRVALFGPRTAGPMAPELPVSYALDTTTKPQLVSEGDKPDGATGSCSSQRVA